MVYEIKLFFIWSGYSPRLRLFEAGWELNPVYNHLHPSPKILVGDPGIEPGLYPPHGHVLPVY